jgi:hypothetical protein
MTKYRYSCVSAVLLGTLAAFACSQAPTSVSPVDSTSSSSSSAVMTTTASRWTTQSQMRAAATGLVVEGTDVITAVTGTCPSIVITIRDTPVTVGSATVFGTGTTCAGLIVGATVHVTGVLTFGTAGAASVAATNISLDGGVAPPTTETVNGTLASFTGICPSVTLTLQGTAGVVVTSSTTTFTPTGSCGTLTAGQIVEAHGVRNSTGQLAATDLTVAAAPAAGSPIGHGHKVGGEGTAANVKGTCPALSMVVLGVHVTTDGSTVFSNGACSTIRNGTKVLVEGNQESDGHVIATSVRITDQPGKGH